MLDSLWDRFLLRGGALRAELYVVKGPDVGKGLAFAGRPRISLGRSSQTDFQVRDTKVSRVHCSIEETAGGYVLHDHSSGNGTYLNGERVSASALHDGDRIAIGKTVVALLIDEKSMSIDGQELMPRRERYARRQAAEERERRAAESASGRHAGVASGADGSGSGSGFAPSVGATRPAGEVDPADPLGASGSVRSPSSASGGGGSGARPEVPQEIAARFAAVKRAIAEARSDGSTPAGFVAADPSDASSGRTPALERAQGESSSTIPSLGVDEAVAHLEDYKVIRQIGRGAKASVYLAEQLSLGRPVAVKVLSPGGGITNRDLRRFMNEAGAVARLVHPHVVTIHDRGQVCGYNYIVMEHLPAGSAGERVRQGPMPVDEAISVALQIASALRYAFGRGIVHRDVKPENILFAEWGGAKLADFGFVKELDPPEPDTTVERGPVGTLSYMAPEMLSGHRPTDATPDIYSLGATLYHMVVGETPFHARSLADHVMAVMRKPPDRPSSRNGEVGPLLERLILRCLEKEPAKRPATPDALIAELLRARDEQRLRLSSVATQPIDEASASRASDPAVATLDVERGGGQPRPRR